MFFWSVGSRRQRLLLECVAPKNLEGRKEFKNEKTQRGFSSARLEKCGIEAAT